MEVETLSAAIIVILASHWFSDFVMQPQSWAKKKSSSNKVLLQHVGLYTLLMCFFSLFLPITALVGVIWAVANGVTHLAIDAVTSRCTKWAFTRGKEHTFFTIIGFDQLLHTAILLTSYVALTS